MRVRLYQSALNGVSYVYGHPIPFSRQPKDIEARERDKEAAIEAANRRLERMTLAATET